MILLRMIISSSIFVIVTIRLTFIVANPYVRDY